MIYICSSRKEYLHRGDLDKIDIEQHAGFKNRKYTYDWRKCMEKQYIVTERAHFMCPNMHFGILLELDAPYEEKRVKASLDTLAQAHPFLRCTVQYEEGTEKLYYAVKEQSMIYFEEKTNIHHMWEDYKRIAAEKWDLFEEGLLKVYVYPLKDGMKVLFVAHHLLADGRSLLELSQEFANHYVSGISPKYIEEKLIKSIQDLPSKSELSGISKLLIKRTNKQWKKEQHQVTYKQYQEFTKEYVKNHTVSYKSYQLYGDKLEEMKTSCKENGISMNDLLMAHMYLKTGTNKIIIAVDIREKIKCYQTGALGNYATAIGVRCKTKTTDVIEKAKEVHKCVKAHIQDNRKLMLVLACYLEIEPTLLDAAAITALGGFKSKAGEFVGGSMFGFRKPSSYSITNLGKINNVNIKEAMFIPPASPAAKMTVGVLTVNEKMQLCSSVYEKM